MGHSPLVIPLLMPPTDKQARLFWLTLSGLAVATLAALAAASVWALGRVLAILSPVLWPLALAGAVAYLLDPVVDFIERKGPSRPRAIACVFGLALAVVLALGGAVLPQLINEARELADRIPAYAGKLEQRVTDWASHARPLFKRLIDKIPAAGGTATESTPTNEQGVSTNAVAEPGARPGGGLGHAGLESLSADLARDLPYVGAWLFGQAGRVASWFAALAGLALVPVYAFYFLLEKRSISSRWTDYLPVKDSAFKNELVFVLEAINNYLIAFFRGQMLVALCEGVLYGVGFLFIGLPYALLLGVAAVVLTLVPFLGAIILCLTALIIALVQYGDWQHPLMVLGVVALVQTAESLVISPKIMRGRVGLHPVVIIIAVMAGTTLLGGLLGGVLAIPLAAALRVVMFRYVWKKRPEA